MSRDMMDDFFASITFDDPPGEDEFMVDDLVGVDLEDAQDSYRQLVHLAESGSDVSGAASELQMIRYVLAGEPLLFSEYLRWQAMEAMSRYAKILDSADLSEERREDISRAWDESFKFLAEVESGSIPDTYPKEIFLKAKP